MNRMVLWNCLKRCIVVLTAVTGAAAHGYLARPAARNVQHNSNYCPWCLNSGGRETVYASGAKRQGLCGDAYAAPRDHEVYGKFASPPRLAGTYKAGGVMQVKVTLTANHMGRWSVALCPLSGPSQATEAKELRQACFRPLQRADGKGPYTYVDARTSAFSVAYRLPKLTCARCVLQWVYTTGNSCQVPGLPSKYSGTNLPSCAPVGPEEFTNCADVALT